MNSTIKLISMHRLEPEKGWSLIIDRLSSPQTKNRFKTGRIIYDIYGQGSMRSIVLETIKHIPQGVSYHGQVALKSILSILPEYDYLLMPSQFLETFGLTALDAASCGVPTIGFAKGGLSQFILPELDITKQPGKTESEQFTSLMRSVIDGPLSNKPPRIDKKTIKTIYGSNYWLDTFISLCNA
ncbi:MAG TPA: glycosyltransferase [Candidatus Absconditabacterales bacterium]|nr:glycosyltransferase [Candidatus Absconditabacterales bacterium]HNG97368.1 glycosyltransferase [Candidatus Absconditabacterales bacterium]